MVRGAPVERSAGALRFFGPTRGAGARGLVRETRSRIDRRPERRRIADPRFDRSGRGPDYAPFSTAPDQVGIVPTSQFPFGIAVALRYTHRRHGALLRPGRSRGSYRT